MIELIRLRPFIGCTCFPRCGTSQDISHGLQGTRWRHCYRYATTGRAIGTAILERKIKRSDPVLKVRGEGQQRRKKELVRVAIGKWIWRVFVAYRLKGVMEDIVG